MGCDVTVGGQAALEQEHLCIFYSHDPFMNVQNQNLGIKIEADNYVLLCYGAIKLSSTLEC